MNRQKVTLIINKILRENGGFTLIEIVVVMAIIAVLAVVVVGAVTVARNTAKETVHRSNAKTIQAGLESYYSRNNIYPAATEDVDGNGVGPNGWDSYSFETISDNDPGHIGVDLAPTPECQHERGWANGGGQVWIKAGSRSYTITPYNHNCAEPMLNDVLLMQNN